MTAPTAPPAELMRPNAPPRRGGQSRMSLSHSHLNMSSSSVGRHEEWGQLLQRHAISVAGAGDLAALQEYRIVFLADDSGSMQVPCGGRGTRWTELSTTISTIIDVACTVTPHPVDVHFLNRPAVMGVRNRDDHRLQEELSRPPNGSTPLASRMGQVLQSHRNSECPILLITATDGQPNEGVAQVEALIRRHVPGTFRFQFLACTDDDAQIGWLNKLDVAYAEVDVTDDYESERREVLRIGRVRQFTHGDYIVKALLGAVCTKFDHWDEDPASASAPPVPHAANMSYSSSSMPSMNSSSSMVNMQFMRASQSGYAGQAAAQSPYASGAEVSFSQIPAAAPQPSGYASQPPPTYAPGDIEAVLGKYDITIAKADDMHVLQNYKIVFIADDSGSMRLSATNGRRMTRWEELQGTLSMLVEVSSAISKGIGIDVHFLNRGGVMNVQPNDSRLQQALQAPPHGGTPLVECLLKLLRHYNQGKPVLFIIATDGEPSEGPRAFKQLVTQVVQGKLFPNGNTTFKFQIMACTDDDDEVGWLDKLDRKFKEVDVTDDFESERRQVLRTGRKRFSRGDYLTKALLGPISSRFDDMDEHRGMLRRKCSIM